MAVFFSTTRPKWREAITAQSLNLLQDFRILPNLVSNDSSHRAEEIGTKIVNGQTFSSNLWLCAVMARAVLGCALYPSFPTFCHVFLTFLKLFSNFYFK